MLKHRIIFGLIFGAVFIAIIFLDTSFSRGWPLQPFSAPPGAFIALGCLILIPLALKEMQTLLTPENVIISMRITIAASLLCMLWPWIEQVSESMLQRQQDLQNQIALSPLNEFPPPLPATAPASSAPARPLADSPPRPVAEPSRRLIDNSLNDQLHAIESSPWFPVAKRIRTVKPHYLVPTVIALALVASLVMHSRRQKVDGAMANAGGTLLAITYLGVLPGFYLPICMTHSAAMLLAIVGIVKAADVGAYASGRLIGKHKLIPWLSPGKTREGFLGGLAFSAITAAIVLCYCFTYRWPQALLFGLVLGAVGQLGDLLESLLKRDAGVKDSGKIPGFGGLLDLLDSPLLAAPAAYWLLKLI